MDVIFEGFNNGEVAQITSITQNEVQDHWLHYGVFCVYVFFYWVVLLAELIWQEEGYLFYVLR